MEPVQWMKSEGVTTQVRALAWYIPVVLFQFNPVLDLRTPKTERIMVFSMNYVLYFHMPGYGGGGGGSNLGKGASRAVEFVVLEHSILRMIFSGYFAFFSSPPPPPPFLKANKAYMVFEQFSPGVVSIRREV